FCRLGRCFGKLSHLIGNHGKTPARLTSPCSLYCSIKSKEVCLVSNVGNGVYKLGYALYRKIQRRNGTSYPLSRLTYAINLFYCLKHRLTPRHYALVYGG